MRWRRNSIRSCRLWHAQQLEEQLPKGSNMSKLLMMLTLLLKMLMACLVLTDGLERPIKALKACMMHTTLTVLQFEVLKGHQGKHHLRPAELPAMLIWMIANAATSSVQLAICLAVKSMEHETRAGCYGLPGMCLYAPRLKLRRCVRLLRDVVC